MAKHEIYQLRVLNDLRAKILAFQMDRVAKLLEDASGHALSAFAAAEEARAIAAQTGNKDIISDTNVSIDEKIFAEKHGIKLACAALPKAIGRPKAT